MAKKNAGGPKSVESLTHPDAKRKNIPSAEHQSVMDKEQLEPVRVALERRNRDLDPQLVWRGKDQQDWSDLVVQAPPLYIQEKVHPKVLIDDLRRQTSLATLHSPLSTVQLDLFADFNGLPDTAAKTEFYQHDAHWSNRMILGDSLQVMASLAEREGLRGKVQCIYLDPPYGIKFNSNFQWSTTSRDVKDGNAEHITREPEQVKAFRDTWRDGIHSYLTYLRDRLMAARDLLTDSGSIFVQIGDENVHRVRAVLDEVFGEENYCGQIVFAKTSGQTSGLLSSTFDYLIWFSREKTQAKFRQLFEGRSKFDNPTERYVFCETPSGEMIDLSVAQKQGLDPIPEGRILKLIDTTSQTGSENSRREFQFQGNTFTPPGSRGWSSHESGLHRVGKAGFLHKQGKHIWWKSYRDEVMYRAKNLNWRDTVSNAFGDERIYVVQTNTNAIQHCILMTTDPGDLVLDPTCGSGTTAYVAEQWGRRWITIDTSRVALALARARIMGARYAYYLLADSPEGQAKEGEVTRTAPSTKPTHGNIRHGFVYERVPHVTLKSIANNAEIDVIWEQWQTKLESLRAQLNSALGTKWEEWEIPRDFEAMIKSPNVKFPNVESRNVESRNVEFPNVEQTFLSAHGKAEKTANKRRPNDPGDSLGRQECLPHIENLHRAWWEARIARQKAIDASIAAKAEFEFLYDKPYEDRKKVRVAGPFTVESLSPHRVLGVDENDELMDMVRESSAGYGGPQDFASMILENLRTAGVQQAHKDDKIAFTSLMPWPGTLVCAEGRFEASGEWMVKSGEGGSKMPKAGSSLATNPSSLSTTEYRAAIFIGPEFGTVSRPDLVEAAREAGDAAFDVLIACAFNYDARSSDFDKLGRIPILKARMNADLHMADTLKNTGKGNLFVIFGEPDIVVASEEWLVDSSGRRLAPYDIFKLVSGVDSLAEINGLGRQDLQGYVQLSKHRAIWDYLADAASGQLDSREHRGGTSAAYDGGVSSIAWLCAGLPRGTGNVCGAFGTAGLPDPADFRRLVEQVRGDQQDAKRADEIAIHSPLTTLHFFQLKVNGVDVFKPQTGEVVSDGPDGIACWFIDTDYNEESFFVRHAYFLGQNDPYKALKTTLKAEINEDAWASLNRNISRPFDKPASGRIAVKVINHLGDEVMKVFRVV